MKTRCSSRRTERVPLPQPPLPQPSYSRISPGGAQIPASWASWPTGRPRPASCSSARLVPRSHLRPERESSRKRSIPGLFSILRYPSLTFSSLPITTNHASPPAQAIPAFDLLTPVVWNPGFPVLLPDRLLSFDHRFAHGISDGGIRAGPNPLKTHERSCV